MGGRLEKKKEREKERERKKERKKGKRPVFIRIELSRPSLCAGSSCSPCDASSWRCFAQGTSIMKSFKFDMAFFE